MANIFDISDKTINKIIGDVDLSPVMIYMIDIVNANALSFLASQFDVEGFKGFDLAITESQKRELIKTSIQIKKHLGTPWAIKQALKTIGFDKVTIQEGTAAGEDKFYSGETNYDGSILYGGASWASFRVTIKTKFSVSVSDETKAMVEKLILFYKNARSRLVEVIYQEDDVYYYDGTLYFNSTINYQ